MKYKNTIRFVLLLITLVITINARAYDFSVETANGEILYYNYNGYPGDGGSVTVVGWGGYSTSDWHDGNLIIPSYVSNDNFSYSVTSIGDYAFYSGTTSFNSVTIPNTVTSIGDYAFYLCYGMTSISIPNSVTSIGGYAFYECRGLTSIIIPESVTNIGQSAFRHCTGLTTVVFNAINCTTMGCWYDPVFLTCTNFNTLIVGENVTTIPAAAFYSCYSLDSINIPNTVTDIGNKAFGNCHGLTTVIIGNSVTNVGDGAFENCTNLVSVYYNGNIAGWCGISFNIGNSNPLFYAQHLYIGNEEVSSLVIPNTVTSIGNNSFCGYIGLTSVSIGDSVIIIGDGAFDGCTGLTTVTFGNSVTSIGNFAFHGCDSIILVTIGNTVTSIGNFAFCGCTGLNSVSIGNSVTSIGNGTFCGCIGLTTVTIPNSVTSIGDYAFDGCTGLTEITCLAQVAPTLGYHGAFYDVSSLIPIYIPCGSWDSYQSGWSYFNNFVEPPAPDIEIQTTDITMGMASITTQPTCHSPAVITATANYGYHFMQWNDGDTNNPRVVTLTQDTSFTAHFAINQYTVSAVSNDSTRGLVMGGATVNYLDTVSLSAFANYGYHFSRWDDYNTDNPRQIVATSNITRTAIFEPNQYNITIHVDTSIHGSCTGGGNYNYLSQRTISAVSNYGYHFTMWSDGDTNNPRIVTLTQDTSFTALFAKNQYTLNVNTNNDSLGTVTLPYGNTAYYLDTLTAIAHPNAHYHFKKWKTVGSVSEDVDYSNLSLNDFTQMSADSTNPAGGNTFRYIVTTSITNTISWFCYYWFESLDGSMEWQFTPRCTGRQAIGYGHEILECNYNDLFTNTTIGNTITYSGLGGIKITYSNIGWVIEFPVEVRCVHRQTNASYTTVYWSTGETVLAETDTMNIVMDKDKDILCVFVPDTHYVSVLTCDSTQGSVVSSIASGPYGELFAIQAVANYGYHFDHWSDGDTNNPRVVTLTQDTVLIAYFAPNQYNVSLESDNTAWGSVQGDGVYNYLDTVTIAANAIEHYHLVHWNDGNTDNPRQIVLTCDTSFTAHFAIDTHTVNVVTSDIARGMVETTGTEFVYGTPCTVTATAYTGYTFAGWSNGVTANPYTFAVLSDVELTALFIAEGEEVYTVNVESANPTMGTVSGGGQALDGGSVVIRAAGNAGYHFTQWNDGNTDSVRTVVVHGNVTYTAYFASDNGTEGIDDLEIKNDIVVSVQNRCICVSGTCGQRVYVYGIDGRMVATRRNATEHVSIPVPATGVYFVKVGNLPARKVVVIR